MSQVFGIFAYKSNFFPHDFPNLSIFIQDFKGMVVGLLDD